MVNRTEHQESNKRNIWVFVSTGSLIIASVLALFLVLMRLPGLPWSGVDIHWFQRILVLHVNLSFVIWLTSAMCYFAHRNLIKSKLNPVQLPLIVFGILAIAVAVFEPNSQPLTVNYLPVVDNLLFMIGLASYFLAVTITIVRAMVCSAHTLKDWMLKCALATLLLAIISPLLASFLITPQDIRLAWFEYLFWSAGHIYVCALGSFIAMLWLSGVDSDDIHTSKKLKMVKCLTVTPFAASLAAIAFSLILKMDPASSAYHFLFQYLMMFTSCLPIAGVLFIKYQALLSSRLGIIGTGLLLLGILQGWFMTHGTLAVPAHYHAMLGLVNLSVFIVLLQETLSKPSCHQRWLMAYGLSVATLSVSLWFAGSFGAPRKVTGSYVLIMENIQWLAYAGVVIGAALMLLTTLVISIRILRLTIVSDSSSKISKLLPTIGARTLR